MPDVDACNKQSGLQDDIADDIGDDDSDIMNKASTPLWAAEQSFLQQYGDDQLLLCRLFNDFPFHLVPVLGISLIICKFSSISIFNGSADFLDSPEIPLIPENNGQNCPLH